MVKNEACPKVNANQKLELMRTFTITIVGYANFSVVRGVHMLCTSIKELKRRIL